MQKKDCIRPAAGRLCPAVGGGSEGAATSHDGRDACAPWSILSMSESVRRSFILAAIAASLPVLARADGDALPHTDWAMLRTAKVTVPSAGPTHGDPSIYRYAPAIPPPSSDWRVLEAVAPSPRNPSDVNYLGPNDDYSSDLRSCFTEVEFTDFECSVSVPAGFVTSRAVITLGPLDDGARVIVFNTAHPTGIVPEDGTLVLGDAKSVDLSAVLKAGEANRIVVQHVDDCGGQSWLGPVELEVKGDASQGGAPRPSWGRLKAMYR